MGIKYTREKGKSSIRQVSVTERNEDKFSVFHVLVGVLTYEYPQNAWQRRIVKVAH